MCCRCCCCAAAASVVRLDCARVAIAVRCSCGIVGVLRASYSQQRITDASKDKDIANSKKTLQVCAKQRGCVVCGRGVNAFDALAGVRKEAIKELEEQMKELVEQMKESENKSMNLRPLLSLICHHAPPQHTPSAPLQQTAAASRPRLPATTASRSASVARGCFASRTGG
jgi:hypothetical protein